MSLRMRSLLPLLPLLVVVLLVGSLAGGLFRYIANVPEPLVGRMIPESDLPALHDPEQRFLSSDMIGRPSLVNFWASWCSTCRGEHPTLTQLGRIGVPVFGFNYRDSREQALDYLDRAGDPFIAVGYDPNGRTSAEWGVHATPVTMLLDRHGRVRFKHIGPLYPELVHGQLLPLFRELERES